MPQTSVRKSPSRGIRVKDPDLYDVILLNDDFTTMDFVVDLLRFVFYKSVAEAEAIMLAVHHHGEGVAGTYTLDIAQSKVQKAMVMARNEGFPLRLKITQRIY